MSTWRVLNLVAVVVFVLQLWCVPSARAIKCYQCNSLYDAPCANLNLNQTTSKSYLKECADTRKPNGTEFFCRKIVQRVLYSGGEKRTIRKCGFQKGERDCYHYDDDDHSEMVCQCFSDACNSAPPRGAPAYIYAAPALLTMVLSASSLRS